MPQYGQIQAVGQAELAAIKIQTADWWSPAMLCGALDGFEFNSEGIKALTDLVMNNGNAGQGFRRVGSPGDHLPAGPMDFDLYYQGAELLFFMLAFGADAESTLVTGAYNHEGVLQQASLDKMATICIGGQMMVKELPSVKLGSFKLTGSSSGDGQRLKGSADLIPFELNRNVGAAVANSISVSAAVANGVRTIIASQPPYPSFISLTYVPDTLAEAVATIVFLDRRNRMHTLVHTFSLLSFSLDGAAAVASGALGTAAQIFTGEHVASVISVTMSGVTTAGTATLIIGHTPGINTLATFASVTIDPDRTPVLFSDVKVYANLQSAGDFTVETLTADNDMIAISGFEIDIDLAADSRVTSRHQYRRDQPTRGGTGYPMVKVSLKKSSFAAGDLPLIFHSDQQNTLKMKFVFTGGRIGTTAYKYSLILYLNGVQGSGEPTNSKAGLMEWDWSGEAHAVPAAPTGVIPSGMTAPLGYRLQNASSVDNI